MSRLLVIALAFSLAACGTTREKAGTTAQRKAESYTCSPEEVKSMKAYYATCMDGAGYFSNYCLDRAVLATCHPRDSKKDKTK